MGKWTAFWSVHDPDDVFAYDTMKFVTIRDRYLGFLHYAFLTAILVYIFGIVIFYQKQFLLIEVPDGTVRLALLNGVGGDPAAKAHCNSNYTQGPPYCVYPTQDQIVTGGGSSSMHVPTSYLSTDYHETCVDPITCNNSVISGPTQYVVANFMNFQISIDHSFQTPSGVTLGDHTPLGYLKSPSTSVSGIVEYNHVVETFESLASDVISMPEFLSAAYVDNSPINLDANANNYLNQNNDPNFQSESYRQFGLVILLIVKYDNIQNYWTGCVRHIKPCYLYTYELATVTQIDDFVQETIYTAYPVNRTTLENRGVRIIGIISGSIGKFDFQTLLIQLTTSLALVKIATTIVDQIALRIMPNRTLYKEAKYEKTEDFSDLRAAAKLRKKQAKLERSRSSAAESGASGLELDEK